MVSPIVISTAENSITTALTTAGIPSAQQSKAQQVCTAVLWDVIPVEELEAQLVNQAGLTGQQAEAVAEQLRTTALSAWQKFWEELDIHQRELNQTSLREQFEDWSYELATEVGLRAAELDTQANIALLLEEFLDDTDKWNPTAIMDYLALRGRLIGVALQIRDLREGFATWVTKTLKITNGTVVLPQPLSAPLVSLLLQYLLHQKIGWPEQETAVIGSIMAQHLAKATGDRHLLTAVYGDTAGNTFMWRPVVWHNGQVVFAD